MHVLYFKAMGLLIFGCGFRNNENASLYDRGMYLFYN